MKNKNNYSNGSENHPNRNGDITISKVNPSDMSKIFSYNRNNVRMRKMNGYIFVCLTDFAKPFLDKNLSAIINSKEITDYVARMSELQNFSSLDLLQVTKGNHSDGREQGTWAHHRVAIRVAQKLSTDFAIWVDDRIEELLTTGTTSIQPFLPNFNSPAEAARAWADQYEMNNALILESRKKDVVIADKEAQIVELEKDSEYTRVILQNKSTTLVTQIAQDYGMSARKFNALLRDLKIQHKVRNQWILYSKYIGRGYVQSSTHSFTHTNGNPDVNITTEWTQKGRLFLYETLKRNGTLPLIETN